jgi:hypothetical protein
MENRVGRAFLNKLLSENQQKELRRLEGPNNVWTGFQICRHFRMKPDPLPKPETEEMHRLLWIWKAKREKIHYAHKSLDDCECLSEADDLDSWLAFVDKEFLPTLNLPEDFS